MRLLVGVSLFVLVTHAKRLILTGHETALSSLAPDGGWIVDIETCPHRPVSQAKIKMFCSKPEAWAPINGSGCADVFKGKVRSTIVRLPRGCGFQAIAALESLHCASNQTLSYPYRQLKDPREGVWIADLRFNMSLSHAQLSSNRISKAKHRPRERHRSQNSLALSETISSCVSHHVQMSDDSNMTRKVGDVIAEVKSMARSDKVHFDFAYKHAALCPASDMKLRIAKVAPGYKTIVIPYSMSHMRSHQDSVHPHWHDHEDQDAEFSRRDLESNQALEWHPRFHKKLEPLKLASQESYAGAQLGGSLSAKLKFDLQSDFQAGARITGHWIWGAIPVIDQWDMEAGSKQRLHLSLGLSGDASVSLTTGKSTIASLPLGGLGVPPFFYIGPLFDIWTMSNVGLSINGSTRIDSTSRCHGQKLILSSDGSLMTRGHCRTRALAESGSVDVDGRAEFHIGASLVLDAQLLGGWILDGRAGLDLDGHVGLEASVHALVESGKSPTESRTACLRSFAALEVNGMVEATALTAHWAHGWTVWHKEWTVNQWGLCPHSAGLRPR